MMAKQTVAALVKSEMPILLAVQYADNYPGDKMIDARSMRILRCFGVIAGDNN